MPKDQYVNGLVRGHRVASSFWIFDRRRGSGNAPHRFKMRDRTGDIQAISWPNNPGVQWSDIEMVRHAWVEGTVEWSDFSKSLEVKVSRLCPLDAEVESTEYMPTAGNFSQLAARLTELVRSIADAHLRSLLQFLFNDRDLRSALLCAPAAHHMHHAYRGGLLEHSLEVAGLCDRIAGVFDEIDRDLLVTAALLHDIGKGDEIDYETPEFAFTASGGLLGHIFMGAHTVLNATREIEGFPPEIARALGHLLLSHHGKHEWGAPILPGVLPAYVLHLCDQLSAYRFYFRKALAAETNGLFTKAPGIEGHVFTGKLLPDTPEAAECGTFDEIAGEIGFIFKQTVEQDDLTNVILLPLVGHIAAGFPSEEREHLEATYPFTRAARVKEGDFLLRVNGDSMTGAGIFDGDVVSVHPQMSAENGDIVVALLDGESTVKIFVNEGGQPFLRAANPAYPDIVPASGDLAVQGKVTGVIRGLI